MEHAILVVNFILQVYAYNYLTYDYSIIILYYNYYCNLPYLNDKPRPGYVYTQKKWELTI